MPAGMFITGAHGGVLVAQPERVFPVRGNSPLPGCRYPFVKGRSVEITHKMFWNYPLVHC